VIILELPAYRENCPNVEISEEEKAMDSFHGLDSNRYGAFKANMMNAWVTKAISTPDTANIVYCLAGSWVKTNTIKTESRKAVTFMTSMENPTSHLVKGRKVTYKLK
jgi:hypothetical protein